jgi:hypothetical protein
LATQGSSARATKDQHFVPRFYLRRFADTLRRVQVLQTRPQLRLLKSRPYSGVCYGKYFYAVETGKGDDASAAFEEFFGALENAVASRLDGILDRARRGALTNEDFDLLAYFMSLQWLRTEYFRQRLNWLQEDMLRKVMPKIVALQQRAGQLSDGAAKELVRVYSEGKLRFTNVAHLMFLSPDRVEGFHNLFYGKDWNIIRATERRRFITSDNPVAEWWPKRQSLYGVTFLERMHFLALAPDLLIEAAPPDIDAKPSPAISRVTYREANDADVAVMNLLIADHSGSYCYAQKRRDLELLLRDVSERGPALRAFVTKYKTPPDISQDG